MEKVFRLRTSRQFQELEDDVAVSSRTYEIRGDIYTMRYMDDHIEATSQRGEKSALRWTGDCAELDGVCVRTVVGSHE